MKDKYYLEIMDKNNFGFIKGEPEEVDGLGVLVEITVEDYKLFFEAHDKGKQFRLKDNPTGHMLFDYVEEYEPELIPLGPPSQLELLQEEVLNQSEMMLDMDFRMTSLELGL